MANSGKTSWWQHLKQKLSGNIGLPEDRKHQMLRDVPLLGIDLELTSLDPQKSKVTSIGWATGKSSSIELDSCFYSVIRAAGDLEQSPVIHGLMPEEIAQGSHIKEVLAPLIDFASTHVWVLHNANLDMSVLHKVCEVNEIYIPNVITLDTLKLAVYQLQKQHDVLPPNSATLTVCRQRLGLPLAPAHNALDDAVATLQLWFAQYCEMDPNGQLSLQDVVHTQSINCQSLGNPPK